MDWAGVRECTARFLFLAGVGPCPQGTAVSGFGLDAVAGVGAMGIETGARRDACGALVAAGSGTGESAAVQRTISALGRGGWQLLWGRVGQRAGFCRGVLLQRGHGTLCGTRARTSGVARGVGASHAALGSRVCDPSALRWADGGSRRLRHGTAAMGVASGSEDLGAGVGVGRRLAGGVWSAGPPEQLRATEVEVVCGVDEARAVSYTVCAQGGMRWAGLVSPLKLAWVRETHLKGKYVCRPDFRVLGADDRREPTGGGDAGVGARTVGD